MFRRGRTTVTIIAAVAALVAIGGIAIVLLPHGHAKTASPSAAPPTRALRVVSVTPAAGATDVNGAAPIRLTLAQDVTAGKTLPLISPAIPGSWHQSGTELTFTPVTGFAPRTHVTISVRAQNWVASYTTGSYSLLRLQQLLSQLGYLPLNWAADQDSGAVTTATTARPGSSGTPASPGASAGSATPASTGTAAAPMAAPRMAAARMAATAAPAAGTGTATSDAGTQLSAAYEPPAGTFSWQPGYPGSLHSFWRAGQLNLITTGAIMAFQSDHGMAMDGEASTAVWNALLRAASAQDKNRHGYTYAIASQYAPETLTIWHDGHRVFRNYANTGIPVSPTAVGTFPVYLRYRFQIMQGTNPDGSRYSDPVQFVSYFHAGEAVHYFPRYSYGWQQSLGCVELPLGSAAQAWPYLTYGSLVTVTPA